MLKKHSILALLLWSLCFVANAQIVTIPDANFKNALLNTACVDTNLDSIPDTDADLDNDGEIQVSEALAVIRLHVDNYSIQSLIGIEQFSQLVFLNCDSNQLFALNVQGLTNLQKLNCYSNKLATLDVQGLSSLQELYCDNNQLFALNVQGLTNLQNLHCYRNKLPALNVQGLTNLQNLNCYFNQLTTLDVQGLTNLQILNCNNNKLTALNVQGLSSLQDLHCENNKLTAFNVQGLTNLQNLHCSSNQLPTLDVQGLTNLQNLHCNNNQLTTLDVQGLSSLQDLHCENNKLTTLNVQGLTNLQNLYCISNKLTTLYVQGLTNLQNLYCNLNDLTTLDVQGLTNLQFLNLDFNELTTIDLQGLTNLKVLTCFTNKLTTLDVQGLTNLQNLFCAVNQLTTLDVQGLTNLTSLTCRGNQFTTLNVKGLTNLTFLDCDFNQFTTLDVQGLTNLQELRCSSNQLTTLDVQGLTNLQKLYCYGNNQLSTLYIKNGSIETSLNFSSNPNLAYICCDEDQLASVQADAILYGLTDCVINTSCTQIGAHIQGAIKRDLNLNCQTDSMEVGLAGRIIKAEKTGADPFYGITNSAGDYEIVLDTGLFLLTVPITLTNNYYALCEDSIWVNLAQISDTVTADFLLRPEVLCPLLEVNIASSIMRRCFQNQYVVQYCNLGPAPAPNAQVTVTLSDDVQFVSSSIPGINISGQNWQFPLGTVTLDTCGSFTINFLVLCDSTVLGQSICATAHITPNSICAPPNSNWSGAEVMVDGYCEGDSVRLVIRNIGTGNMTTDQAFEIIEDNVILKEGTFNLSAQDSLIIKVPANGSTYRLEAEQEITFPFFSQPSVTVEGCSLNLGGSFSLGFVSQFNEEDGNPFYSTDCRDIIGSYDPNDKSAQPTGVGTAHFVEPKTPIDYQIRFQNTGTDTAFTVVIRDTLSTWLDIESFKAGISDHAFRVDFEGHNMLKFTFDHILLPDSNVNEAASHGFVQFRISPKASTPLGTKIENRAAIFFDFNAPVITNWVYHTVDTGFLDKKVVSVFPETMPAQQQMYPNPVRAGDLLFFGNLPVGNSRISMIDPLGKVVFAAELVGDTVRIPSGLAGGVYFLEWTGATGERRWGKVVVKG
jgi:Leucine-rich repeat (LRR) protein